MSSPFVAEIRMFAGNFAPRGWALCAGQLMAISQNTALFSLLGTTYGGDGRSTFGLPDLQGRAPMFWGQGPGLSLRSIGETGGSETVSLLQSEIPAHSHTFSAAPAPAERPTAENGVSVLARSVNGNLYRSTVDSLVMMNPNAISPAGGDQPHNNMQPYLCVTFIIALQGVFPPRT